MTPKKLLACTFGVLLAFGVCSVQAQTKFLADRHVERGLNCESCHTDAAKGTLRIAMKPACSVTVGTTLLPKRRLRRIPRR